MFTAKPSVPPEASPSEVIFNVNPPPTSVPFACIVSEPIVLVWSYTKLLILDVSGITTCAPVVGGEPVLQLAPVAQSVEAEPFQVVFDIH